MTEEYFQLQQSFYGYAQPTWVPVEALVSPKATRADILRAMLLVLDDEERWTKGAAARDSFGRAVHSTDPAAAAWCMAGALQRVLGMHIAHNMPWTLRQSCQDVQWLLTKAVRSLNQDNCPSHWWESIPSFNDDSGTTYEDVRLVLKQALTEAESEDPAIVAVEQGRVAPPPPPPWAYFPVQSVTQPTSPKSGGHHDGS